MINEFRIPWEKYGLITYLAKKVAEFNIQFGKTSLQKIIYILQEIYNVNVGYNYIFYNYGPYSAELANDLDYVAALNGVEVSWVSSGGYSIKPDTDTDSFIEKSEAFLEKNKDSINEAINEFGQYTAKELELRATIIYLIREYNDSITEKELIKQVNELKPYFSLDKIEYTIKELKQKEII